MPVPEARLLLPLPPPVPLPAVPEPAPEPACEEKRKIVNSELFVVVKRNPVFHSINICRQKGRSVEGERVKALPHV